MTNDDVIHGFRLQLFDLAARTTVTNACRVFGVHRSTYYRWAAQVDRHGLVILEAPRAPGTADAEPDPADHRGAHPRVFDRSSRPRAGPDQLRARDAKCWGGLRVSPNGVWRVLRRHGLNHRRSRYALIAGYQAPYAPPRQVPDEPHIDTTRPGELVGIDCFYVGRLRGTTHPVWQITAIDCHSSYGWATLISCPSGQPTSRQTSTLARRVAADLAACGWRLERVLFR